MTPDNNALKRTYLIGGSPRVGKTTLAYRLSEYIKGHVISTDAIRNAAKKVCEDKTGPLFMINHYNELSEEVWLDRFANNPKLSLVTKWQNPKQSGVRWYRSVIRSVKIVLSIYLKESR